MSLSVLLPPQPASYLLLGSLPLLVLSESNSRSHAGTGLFKMLSSVAFVAGPAILTTTEWVPYRQLITTGLAFSTIGDFFLIPSGRDFYASKKEKKKQPTVSFQLGVVAFAAAHIAYIAAFLRDSRSTSNPILATTFLATMALAKWLGVIYPPARSSGATNVLNLEVEGEMRPLVSVYAAIISAMLATAAATVPGEFQTPWPYQRVLGAGLFVVSDLFVALEAFGRGGGKRGWGRILVGYALYFWGQMVIAGTVG